jgi:hypothetical protein
MDIARDTEDDAGPVLLRPEDAARRLGLTVRTLEMWRRRKRGPRFVRLTARVIRYPLPDLEAFIREHAS